MKRAVPPLVCPASIYSSAFSLIRLYSGVTPHNRHTGRAPGRSRGQTGDSMHWSCGHLGGIQ